MKTTPVLVCALLVLAAPTWAAPAAAPTNAPADALPAGGDASDNYHIVPSDRLSYMNKMDPAPNNTTQVYLVNSRGDLEVPVSRGFDEKVTVPAKGRTVLEVKKDLQAKLEAQYYRTSSITLKVEGNVVHPGTVVFYGEVKGIMQLPAGEPKYLSDSILDMKPSEFVNLKNVQLIRRGNDNKPLKPIIVNVEKILREGLKEKDYILQDGDHVIIKAKMLNFN